MRDSQRQARQIRADTAGWPIPALVDDALATYMEWRETTDAIAESYRRWSVAPAGQQARRFAAYIAALDEVHTAAAVYAESISELERWRPDPDPGRRSDSRAGGADRGMIEAYVTFCLNP